MKLVLSLMFILLSVAGAAAQVKNNTSKIPAADVFIDKAKGFSIELPGRPFDTKINEGPEKGGSETEYKWLLREGAVFIVVTNFKEKAFDSQKDFDAYLKDLLLQLEDVPTLRTVSQRPLPLGKFYGAEICRQSPKGKTVFTRIFARGHMMYTLTASIEEKVNDAQPLMIAALDSFKITTK